MELDQLRSQDLFWFFISCVFHILSSLLEIFLRVQARNQCRVYLRLFLLFYDNQ